MYCTREGSKRVRWWNVSGGVLFVLFLLWSMFLRPDEPNLRSWQLWCGLAVGGLSVVLMPEGMRFRRGHRTQK